ncbi:MAG: hypothetical protein ACQEWM_03695 [Actinomycetota bacterium]
MRRAHTGRMLGVAAVTSVTVLGLSACFIPLPPPVPSPANADPIVQGSDGAEDVREGFIASGDMTTVELQIVERSAVVLTASSPDDEDLTMRLIGEGADLENDDNEDGPEGFAFEMRPRNPLIGAVLEPGTYSIELAEWGGDRTRFQLQVIATPRFIEAGQSIDVAVAPGQPGVMMVSLATGDESITAVADFDSVLWAQVPGSAMTYSDDDSGGNRNPLVALEGEQPQDIVVVVSSYDGEGSGSVLLSVE